MTSEGIGLLPPIHSRQIYSLNAFFTTKGIPPNESLAGRIQKRVRCPGGTDLLGQVSIEKEGQRFDDPICPGMGNGVFLCSNLGAEGTCRTESSESSHLFLFVISNPWTDFDFGYYRKSRFQATLQG